MVETRIAPRHRVRKPAEIDYGGDKIHCTIHDISTTGAALEFAYSTKTIPAAFTLLVPEDRLKLPCRVVCRTEFRVGVAFQEGVNKR
jgi:hypothetical protein